MSDILLMEKYKNQKLFETLKGQIETYVLKSGDRLPAERKLCELYKCSRTTVRSCLKQLEEQKLVKRVRGSGTYVSGHYKQKRLRRNIGIMVSTPLDDATLSNDPYLSRILLGLQSEGGSNRCNFSLQKFHPNETLVSYFDSHRGLIDDFDGLVCLMDSLSHEEVAFLRQNNTPFVTTMPAAEGENVSYVAIDNVQGIYMAFDHLLSHGRKNPRFLCGPLSAAINQARLKGFKKALKVHGIEYKENMYFPVPFDKYIIPQRTKELAADWMEHPFDSLVIAGELCIFPTFQALQESNIRIPQDIAVAMYGDLAGSQGMTTPSITAVRQPLMEQAKRMLRILANMIDRKEDATVIEILQPELIIRKSCGFDLNIFNKEA